MVDTIRSDAHTPLLCLRFDGGVTRNDFVSQFCADMVDFQIERSVHADMTAVGACFMAGLGSGTLSLFPSILINFSFSFFFFCCCLVCPSLLFFLCSFMGSPNEHMLTKDEEIKEVIINIWKGLWKSQEELRKLRKIDKVFTPAMDANRRARLFAKWQKGVALSMHWADDDDEYLSYLSLLLPLLPFIFFCFFCWGFGGFFVRSILFRYRSIYLLFNCCFFCLFVFLFGYFWIDSFVKSFFLFYRFVYFADDLFFLSFFLDCSKFKRLRYPHYAVMVSPNIISFNNWTTFLYYYSCESWTYRIK